MEQIKVYLIGSISTRGCFHYCSKEIYEDLYKVVGLQYQSSFISLMSKPQNLDKLDLTKVDSWSQKVINRDIKKVFLDELKRVKPDYIIVDLVSEIEGGVLEIQGEYISNIKGKTNKLNFKDYDIRKIDIKNNTEEYIELLKNKIELFRLFCKENLPTTKIIFHVAQYSYSYFDGCRVAKSFIDRDIMKSNKLLKELYYTHCIKSDDLVIDINNKTYFATTKHKLPLNPLHYELAYYKDFNSELNRVALKDLISGGINNVKN